MKTTDKRFIGLSADAIVTIENADRLLEQGLYGDAVGLYSEVIAVSPTAYCYAKRGCAKFEAGDFPAAILDFNRALDLKPDSPITLRYRARSKEGCGDLKGAVEDYRTSLSYGERADTHWDIGMILQYLGDHGAANVEYESALRVDPDYLLARKSIEALKMATKES